MRLGRPVLALLVVFLACADGQPGDPCAGDADCESLVRETVGDPGGARAVCP